MSRSLGGVPRALLFGAGAAAGFWLSGCSVFGARDTPEPNYEVVAKLGEDGEVRRYSEMILATTEVEAADYDEASGKAFRKLADYIFGSNIKDEEIGMTAPVFQQPGERDGEQIGMTAPVFRQQEGQNRWRMSFVMPSRYDLESLPKPKDEAIEIELQPAKTLAVLKFSGSLDDELAATRSAELLTRLEGSPWRPVGQIQSAGYDPPFTIPMLRRNEVLVPVEKAP